MVDRYSAMFRLNKEREYEDELIGLLTDYYLLCLDSVKDIENKEKAVIKKGLTKIFMDCQTHSHLFNQLLQMVLVSEKDNF